MTDFVPKHPQNVSDAALTYLQEVIAEKDAEILRLKRELDRRPFLEPDEHIGKDSEVIAREAEIARLEARVRALETNTICRSPAREVPG
jgi:hypothetical protein